MRPLRPEEQFIGVDDQKMKMTLIGMADKWNEFARAMIYETYNDVELLNMYKAMRTSGIYQSGSKDKTRRKVIEFPNGYVFNFCKAVFEPMYGKKWAGEPRVWQHELVRPWLVIELKK